MSTLNKLEELVGQEHLVKSTENLDFCKQDENNSRQADNNRIVELVLNVSAMKIRLLS